MEKHMKECAKVFLRDQKKLFDEPVVYDLEEAEDFLEECFAHSFICFSIIILLISTNIILYIKLFS